MEPNRTADATKTLSLYLGSEETSSELQKHRHFILEVMPTILDGFYGHFANHPLARHIFRNSTHVEHAKKMLLEHWKLITRGTFDERFEATAIRIGEAHRRIGVRPSVYISGYAFVIARLNDAVLRRPSEDGWGSIDDRSKLQAVLVTVAMLDMDLALSVYAGIERRSMVQTIKRLAQSSKNQDQLTGLPNRWAVEALFTEVSQRPQNGWTVLKLDIDRLHQVNNVYGTALGDAVIKHCANVIRENLRPGDVLARVSGDEFAIICPNVIIDGNIIKIATRIVEALNRPVTLDGTRLNLGVSVGVAVGEAGKDTPAATWSRARTALQFAKSKGRGTIIVYSDDMHQRLNEFTLLAEEIAVAVEQEQFVAFYQPQFRASDLRLVGAEVLMRWHHPTKGILGPGMFLETARKLNWSDKLDNLVLAQVEADYFRWERMGVAPKSISINADLARLSSHDFVSRLTGTLPKGVLKLELLESSLMDEVDDLTLNVFRTLRDNHIEWEIDDFGTGHSSILGLIKLKPACVKIARELLPKDTTSVDEIGLLSSAVAIAKSVGSKVTIEGVELDTQIEIGRRVGADKLQGFRLGKPMAPSQFTELLKLQNGLSGARPAATAS